MTGKLTTHVLDTANGVPAAGMRVELYLVGTGGGAGADASQIRLADVHTDSNGRCAQPLLAGVDLKAGDYELRFHAGDYFAVQNDAAGGFLNIVPVRFTLTDSDAHYHVPLLVSPWSYTTYRGS